MESGQARLDPVQQALLVSAREDQQTAGMCQRTARKFLMFSHEEGDRVGRQLTQLGRATQLA